MASGSLSSSENSTANVMGLRFSLAATAPGFRLGDGLRFRTPKSKDCSRRVAVIALFAKPAIIRI